VPSLSVAISPCPNDTLMFDALINSKIVLNDFSFNVEFHDIEQLNNGLMQGKWDIAKMSTASYPLIRNDYVMLKTGMAMGFGNGPLIVSKNKEIDLNNFNDTMLIPGKHTTANLLLSKFFPNITNKKQVLFSNIMPMLANDEAEAGLIIHESRFTYQANGLQKIADMGELWYGKTNMPLPLGVIVAKRSLGHKITEQIELFIKNSVIHGLEHRENAMDFVRCHANEISDEVINKHIDLYVNKYSHSPSARELSAILTLLQSLPENHSLSLHDIFLKWEN